MDSDFLKLVLAVEGLTRAVLEVKEEVRRINEEGIVVVAAPDSTNN